MSKAFRAEIQFRFASNERRPDFADDIAVNEEGGHPRLTPAVTRNGTFKVIRRNRKNIDGRKFRYRCSPEERFEQACSRLSVLETAEGLSKSTPCRQEDSHGSDPGKHPAKQKDSRYHNDDGLYIRLLKSRPFKPREQARKMILSGATVEGVQALTYGDWPLANVAQFYCAWSSMQRSRRQSLRDFKFQGMPCKRGTGQL